MTPCQIIGLVFCIAAILAVVITFILTWRKATLPKSTAPQKQKPAPSPPKYRPRPLPPKSAPQLHRLPKSFTNRPGVKQAQVNLKKAGYREDAKIEEEPKRRR